MRSPEEFEKAGRVFTDALCNLSVDDLRAVRSFFPNLHDPAVFEWEADADVRRHFANAIFDALRDLRADRQRLGDLMRALEVLRLGR